MKKVPQSFFKRSALEVAPDLLGKVLVMGSRRSVIREVEVYDGIDDLANHASKGKTKRTEVMFEEGGHIYIYLVYGMHHMFNIVTGEVDDPSAVLIRGVEDVSGPGRFTREFGIDMSFNGKMIGDEIWIEEGIEMKKIIKTPRIGVDYAGEWALKHYRFLAED